MKGVEQRISASYRRCGGGLVGSVLALAVAVPPARADAATLDVRWSGPADCQRRDALLKGVLDIRGGPRISTPMSARVEVTRVASGRLHVELLVERGDSQSWRAFDAESCDGALAAAALIAAVASDEGGSSLPAPGPVAGERSTGAPAGAAEHGSGGLRVDIAAAGVGDVGTLPEFAPGAEVSIGAQGLGFGGRARVRALVTMDEFAEQNDALPGYLERAEFQLLAVSARACASFLTASIDVGPCVGGELDSLSARGQDAAGFAPNAGRTTWTALSTSLLTSARLAAGMGFFVRVDGNVLVTRPHFDMQTPSGRETVDRPSPVSARAAAGLEFFF